MTQLFQDGSRDAFRESGTRGFLGFVAASVSDYIHSIVREHWESVMVNRIRFRKHFSRVVTVCLLVVAALSASLWVASRNESIGMFGLRKDTMSLRFARGVMEFRHIYAPSIETSVPREQWHEVAVRRGWIVPPEPKMPGFAFSTGHVLGQGGTGTDGNPLPTIAPAEYGLLRVPLWILVVPLVVWSVLILKRNPPRLWKPRAGKVAAIT